MTLVSYNDKISFFRSRSSRMQSQQNTCFWLAAAICSVQTTTTRVFNDYVILSSNDYESCKAIDFQSHNSYFWWNREILISLNKVSTKWQKPTANEMTTTSADVGSRDFNSLREDKVV